MASPHLLSRLFPGKVLIALAVSAALAACGGGWWLQSAMAAEKSARRMAHAKDAGTRHLDQVRTAHPGLSQCVTTKYGAALRAAKVQSVLPALEQVYCYTGQPDLALDPPYCDADFHSILRQSTSDPATPRTVTVPVPLNVFVGTHSSFVYLSRSGEGYEVGVDPKLLEARPVDEVCEAMDYFVATLTTDPAYLGPGI